MINYFLIALPLTILIEISVLLLLSISKDFDYKKFSNKNIIFAGIIASSLTLPYLYFVFPYFFHGVYYIMVGEIIVTLIEAVFYMFFFEIKFTKAFYISLLANLTSFGIGLILF